MPTQPTSDLDKVRAYFLNFGLRQAPEAGSPLYHTLCWGAIDDPDILQLAASCPPSQPSANILFASVHYPLLGGFSILYVVFTRTLSLQKRHHVRLPKRHMPGFKILSGPTSIRSGS